MIFTLINGITDSDIRRSKFIIYAHSCSKGIYIGMSSDPVEAWQSYYNSAMNETSLSYELPFRRAIRAYQKNFKHYVVAVANSETIAKNKKASAIQFYKANLNTRNEIINSERDYRFSTIENSLGINIALTKAKRKASDGFSDSDRKTVIAEIYIGRGRKRLRTISGQAFPEGMNINCSREERDRFSIGDKVKVNVAMTKKPSGGKYLVAAATTKFIKV